MKWLQRTWLGIPRRRRAVLNLLAVPVLCFLIYCFLGCPPISAEQEFRRMEKTNLVGPSVILETVEQTYNAACETLIIAQTGEGICFYRHCESHPSLFDYREKTGDITVLASPGCGMNSDFDNDFPYIPVYIFDDYPQAVRAELELDISNPAYPTNHLYGQDPNPVVLDKHYSLEARREGDGFFRFDIVIPKEDPEAQLHRYALDYLVFVCHGSAAADASIPATVRLYDEIGQLVAERSLTIRSTAFETHASHTE